MDNKNLAEELALEAEATQVVKEDEIRSKVIEEFGFDETADGEKIDKLVLKEVESRKKLSQAIGQKRKYRDEVEKAKVTKPEIKTVNEPSLSIKDMHALRDVHDDDVDDILEYAKLKQINVAEAKKSSVVLAILADKNEKRETAKATNTGTVRRTTQKVSDEALIEKASKGDVPEDEESINRLIAAKVGYNRKKE